ncbi:hypothetical protein MN032_10805 [Agromyces atrinae]|uniref:hypothetical protein n=1 Tax=Agromyces atrinae TaxID=592376 RepID=UPI001F5601F8|nr:hypothetical protein [Agromyces atrinae]MCI2958186.1 hypothetical protein [Agromyces atrinae]
MNIFKRRARTARQTIAERRGTKPSARETFAAIRPKLLDSRPIIGHVPQTVHADGSITGGEPIYGAPTLRNTTDGKGNLV